MKKKSVGVILNLVIIGFIFLTVLGIIKTIFISSDIDEAYAIAQAYRLCKGDKLLINMWEPHQFSAYLPAVFMKLFIEITGGTNYVVIFLRIIGSLIHIGLGFWLYKVSCKFVGKTESIFLFFLHLNFLTKWLQIPEFELMNYWYILINFLAFIYYYRISSKKIYLIISGICMMLQLLNYPTMILIYPFYMIGILKVSKKVRSEIFISTISAIIPGIFFIIYLFSYMNINTLFKSLSYVMSDPSHMERLLSERMLDFGISALKDIGLMAGFLVVIFFILFMIMKKDIKKILLISFSIDVIIYCIIQIYGCLFMDENQFFMQSRYLLIAVFSIFIYVAFKPKEKEIFWFGIIPGFVSMFAALLLTNMTMNVAYSKLYICVISCFLLLFMLIKNKIFKIISYIMCIFLLINLFICKLILIRVTGCLPVTINANFEKIQIGPLKGIYMVERTANTINDNCSFISEYVSERDNLFYFGCENLIYLCTEANVSVASVQGTSVFNQSFLDYFKENPYKYPTVVAVDKNFNTDYYMVYNPYNYIIDEWIEKEFEYSNKIETDNMILYIR